MSYLRYLCLFTNSGVLHILCCVFVLLASSCVPYVASFSGLFLVCVEVKTTSQIPYCIKLFNWFRMGCKSS
jgi:hypothetical protein